MFWRTSYTQPSQVDVLLEQSSVSLVDLLDCMDMLQECKTKSPNLCAFLSSPSITKQLLDYALLKPPIRDPKSVSTDQVEGQKVIPNGDSTPMPETELSFSDEDSQKDKPESTAEQESDVKPTTGESTEENQDDSQNGNGQVKDENAGNEESRTENANGDAMEIGRNAEEEESTEEENALGGVAVKYGYIATEIFASDIPTLYDTLFQTPQLLQSFIDDVLHRSPSEVDSIMASNWAKVLSALLLKRTIDSIHVIKSQPQSFIKNLITHGLQNSAIMQILLKLVGIEELLEARGQGVLEWLVECDLIPLLVEQLDGSKDPEIHFAAASAVLDIIAICQSYATEPVMSGRSLLVNQLKCHSTMAKLLEYMLDNPESPEFKSSFTNGMTICIELIRRSCSPDPLSMPDEQGSPEGMSPEPGMYDANQDPSGNGNGGMGAQGRQVVTLDAHELVLLLSERLKTFRDMLTKPPTQNNQPLMTTMGPLTPLGIERLRVLELLCELVRYARMDVERGMSLGNHARGISNSTFQDGLGAEFNEDTPGQAVGSSTPTGTSLNVENANADDHSSETLVSPAGRARAILVDKLIQSKILVTCIELFFMFPWNNLLHGIVYDMIFRILNGPLPICRELALTVLKDAQLLRRIAHAHRSNDYSAGQPRGLRLGYMGHITLVADEVVKFMDQDEFVRQQLGDVVEGEEWVEYVTRTLPLLLARDRKALGGERPSTSPTPQYAVPAGKGDSYLPFLPEGDDDDGQADDDKIKSGSGSLVGSIVMTGLVGDGSDNMNLTGNSGSGAHAGSIGTGQHQMGASAGVSGDVPAAFGEDDAAEDDDDEDDDDDDDDDEDEDEDGESGEKWWDDGNQGRLAKDGTGPKAAAPSTNIAGQGQAGGATNPELLTVQDWNSSLQEKGIPSEYVKRLSLDDDSPDEAEAQSQGNKGIESQKTKDNSVEPSSQEESSSEVKNTAAVGERLPPSSTSDESASNVQSDDVRNKDESVPMDAQPSGEVGDRTNTSSATDS